MFDKGGTVKWIMPMLLLVACGGAATEEDLAPIVAPIEEAQELLENFENQVGAGLTYGDMVTEWPGVSADVVGLIDDIVDDVADVADLPEDDRVELLAYGAGVARAHDLWAETVEKVADYLRDDVTPESDISTAYRLAALGMVNLDVLRNAARTPGAATTTT